MNKATIIVTRYNEPNSLIHPCLVALSKQRNISTLVYFLDQEEDNETKVLCNNLSTKNVKIVYKIITAKSLSYARNLGIKLSKTDIILFTDSDAIPSENWASELTRTFTINNKIAIVGGKAIAKWLTKPKWYHHSNILMDAYSTIDLGEETKETDKIVGVNFGFKKSLLKKEASFDENLGRRPGSLLGGEETDLCERTIKKGFSVFYNGKAVVQHQIQKDRMNLSWIFKRSYYWGYGRAIAGGMPKTYTTKRNFYDKLILLLILFPYSLGFLRGKIKK